MNETKEAAKPPGEIHRSRPLPAAAERPEKLAGETEHLIKKLDSLILENRTRIDRGWTELNRLDQTLASLDTKLDRISKIASAGKLAAQEAEARQPLLARTA